jgi:(2R)-3-sulfolactate dehydrogenase (NADP+)
VISRGRAKPKQRRLSIADARALISGALAGAGTAPRNARYFTEAILDTELSGLEGHGFYWLQFYCAHVVTGKVDGTARPKVKMLSPVSIHVNANRGFAHPAIEAGFKKLVPAAKRYGVAAMAVHASYNAATLGFHTGALAKLGLVAFGFTNAMAVMAPVGGRKPVIGTNPLSFAVPGPRGTISFLIDQSATAVTWTAVKTAANAGRKIPLGWALDKNGKPTDDPVKGLAGSMVPSGGYKGFGQGLIVEVMCAAMANSCLGPDMGSFSESDGKPIGCGQFFIALDPKRFAGKAFEKQIKALTSSITSQKGARLPNARRAANIKARLKRGLKIDSDLHRTLMTYVERKRTTGKK